MDAELGSDVPTAEGLMLCLRALAEEAASLNLRQTYSAIERAMRLVATEAMAPQTVSVLH